MEPHRAGIARHRTVARPRHLRGEGGCTEARIPSVGPVGVRSNSSRCGGDGFGGRALLSGRVALECPPWHFTLCLTRDAASRMAVSVSEKPSDQALAFTVKLAL